MPAKPDPATWLSSADVARELGVKPRTVVDLVQKEKLHPLKYQRPGHTGGAISLFDPAEVAGLADERRASRTEVVPVNDGLFPVAPRPASLPMVRVVEAESLSLPIDRKRYLSLEEASAYTGVGKEYIRRHCEPWPIGPHGRIVYRRVDLDQL